MWVCKIFYQIWLRGESKVNKQENSKFFYVCNKNICFLVPLGEKFPLIFPLFWLYVAPQTYRRIINQISNKRSWASILRACSCIWRMKNENILSTKHRHYPIRASIAPFSILISIDNLIRVGQHSVFGMNYLHDCLWRSQSTASTFHTKPTHCSLFCMTIVCSHHTTIQFRESYWISWNEYSARSS